MIPQHTLGFLGTGTITAHMVRGLQGSALADWPILLSPRNPDMARNLATLPGVQIAADNQDVLDRADLIILALRPQVAEAVLRDLRFAPDKPVISLIAAAQIETLQDWTGVRQLCRAIPLPFVERRTGVTPVFPPMPQAMHLFAALGQTLAVDTAHAFDVYSATSALMGSYFGLVDTASQWMQAQGIANPDTMTYLRALFADLGHSLRDSPLPPDQLRHAHSTKGGLNEQLHRVFADHGGSTALTAGLASVLARITALRPPA